VLRLPSVTPLAVPLRPCCDVLESRAGQRSSVLSSRAIVGNRVQAQTISAWGSKQSSQALSSEQSYRQATLSHSGVFLILLV